MNNYIYKKKSEYIFLVIILILFYLLEDINGKREQVIHPNTITINPVKNLLHNYTLVSTYLYTTKTTPLRPKRKYEANPNCYFLILQIKEITRTFCIKKEIFLEDGIAKRDMTIIVHGEYKLETKEYTLQDLKIPLAHGYDILQPSSSSAVGFIEHGRFYGKLHTEQSTYYLEPIHKFSTLLKMNIHNHSSKSALLYEAKDVKLQSVFFNDEMNVGIDLLEMAVNLTKKNIKREAQSNNLISSCKKRNVEGRLCPMLLVADYIFLRDIGSGQVRSTVTQMLLLLDEADAIFRNTDFDDDGVPDNIGFEARYVVVMASPSNPQNKFQWPGSDPMDGHEYLQRMALESSLLERVCLGVAFTARPFLSRALGISFTAPSDNPEASGGLCERPVAPGISLNVLALTLTTESGERVPWRMATLSLAHELGHSFGSSHDPDGPCSGFLMAATSLSGNERRQYSFSPCSLRQMNRVLETRGDCLEANSQPYCGNGLVEVGEDCDCGLPIECGTMDPCCVPRGAKGPHCSVNRDAGYVCHPSQGLCCTKLCQPRDVSGLGLDCSTAIRQRCPCEGNRSCSCGLLGVCSGRLCHSLECTRLGLAECSCSWGQTLCGTCCRAPDGSCSPADQLTRRLLQDGNVTLRSLRHLASPTGPAETRRVTKLCQNDECLQVEFRVWPRGGFCVTHGGLGRCSPSGLCDITMPLGSTFPDPQLRSADAVTRAHALLCGAIALAGMSLTNL